MTQRRIELRSDTFTRPTERMRRAMYEAEVGDDVWDEDPTVDRLEAYSAELMGKEAGLFVSSGTQGNLVGLLSHTDPGNEVILGDQSHIFWYECGGAAVVGGLQFRALPTTAQGGIEPAEIQAAIRAPDIHAPRTGCIALENTHNRCGGTVLNLEYIREVSDIAHEAGVPFHLDGARIFNAAEALRLDTHALASPADSVTFCLSKALGAPVGSVLCGTEEFIARARRWRKLLGGGMRQVGVLAAAGLVALEDSVHGLAVDQTNARALARGLAGTPGIQLDESAVQSNMVAFDIANMGVTPAQFCERLATMGVLMAPAGPNRIRAVTSYEVNREDIDVAVQAARQVAEELAPAFA